MNIRLLTEDNLEFLSLIGGCIGSSESTLVKIPHCWKSHVTAHMFPPIDRHNVTFSTLYLLFIDLHVIAWEQFESQIQLNCLFRSICMIDTFYDNRMQLIL